MIRLLIFTVLFGLSINPIAQNENRADLKFKNDKYDVGKVAQGKSVTINFDYSSIGDEPLTVTDVKPTCTCTVAEFTKLPLKKGEKGTIKVTYSAINSGPFNKTIIITSNARIQTKYLVVSGNVVASSAILTASTLR